MIADMTLSMGSYDAAGRMLTKTHSVNGMTRYEWDGMDIVREYGPSTTGSAVYDSAHLDTDHYGWTGTTSYYVVNGVLRGVDFDGGGTCAVISDAMGHVRAVVDPSGNTVFSASYNAYGDAINVSDSTPGAAFAARYVGAYGCRWDADTGLTYMQQRWYDGAGTQRFVSRDPLSPNSGTQPFIRMDPVRPIGPYTYSSNSPMTRIDPSGEDDTVGTGANPADYAAGGAAILLMMWWFKSKPKPPKVDDIPKPTPKPTPVDERPKYTCKLIAGYPAWGSGNQCGDWSCTWWCRAGFKVFTTTTREPGGCTIWPVIGYMGEIQVA